MSLREDPSASFLALSSAPARISQVLQGLAGSAAVSQARAHSRGPLPVLLSGFDLHGARPPLCPFLSDQSFDGEARSKNSR